MTSEGERNAEIWSTRVQKELLALTTDNADAESTDEVRSMLPPFCRVHHHELSIEQGRCVVDFEVKVDIPPQGAGGSEKKECVLVVSVDASLAKHRSNGKIDLSKPAYPFYEPMAYLHSGQEFFPVGSTIRNGNRITMDLDWTPSLHLTDVIMNIGLKIKESILQMEPFHPAPLPSPSAAQNAFAAFGKALSGVKNRKVKKTPSPKKRHPTTPEDVRIGDEIDLLTEPWAAAHGVYSCKAIRRPQFVEKAMQTANERQEQEAFQSPTAMFRSFAQSARSVMEESFLMITETHIIELRANKLNMTTAKVSLAISIDVLAKLKFRRQESLSLFFKPAPDDPLIYMCPDSGDAVHQIQSVLKRHGVKGKHTNAAAHRAISEALHLVQEIQTKELALKHDPTTARVNEIMDLYRQAAERFEVAGDIRHEEVVTHMRKFLALPLTASILDGSFVKPEEPTPKKTSQEGVPDGEVIESPSGAYDDDDETEEGGMVSEKEKENDKAFEENIDNLLKEAQSMKLDGTDDTTSTTNTTSTTPVDAAGADGDSGLSDVAADLDAMMAAADKELAELMKV
jgi:hypothetical protein